MKRLILAISLLCSSFMCVAQVYTFKPNYSCKLTYGAGDMDELWFEKVYTTTISTFTVDLDNKTITVPEYVTPYPIEKISRDEKNNLIILKMKGNKDAGMVWSYYEIKMDNDGKIIYIQNVERLTGKRFAEDTFFHMYTNDLRTLSFSRNCKWVKSNMALSEDKKKADEEVSTLFNTKFSDGENTISMRGGYLYWKEGTGRKAKVQHFKIDTVTAVDRDGLNGIVIDCYVDDGRYSVFYMYTKHNLDPSQYSWSRYITIDRYEGDRRKWKMVFK